MNKFLSLIGLKRQAKTKERTTTSPRLDHIMSEAMLHPVPSETHVREDLSHIYSDYRRFIARNRDVIITSLISLGALFVQRAMLRQELRRLNFAVEIFPEDEWGDYGNSRFDED